MMKSIHDVNLTFKLFLLAGPRFDELGAESRGCVELHTLFNDAKSTSEMKMAVKTRISAANEIVYCMHLFVDGGSMGHKTLDLICKNLTCAGVNFLSHLFSTVTRNILTLPEQTRFTGLIFSNNKKYKLFENPRWRQPIKLHTLIGFKTVSVTPGLLHAYHTSRAF